MSCCVLLRDGNRRVGLAADSDIDFPIGNFHKRDTVVVIDKIREIHPLTRFQIHIFVSMT